jgi:hypothetical protein
VAVILSEMAEVVEPTTSLPGNPILHERSFGGNRLPVR